MTTRVFVALDLERTDDEPGRAPGGEAIRDEVEAVLENTVVEVAGFTWEIKVAGIGGSRKSFDESIALRRDNRG